MICKANNGPIGIGTGEVIEAETIGDGGTTLSISTTISSNEGACEEDGTSSPPKAETYGSSDWPITTINGVFSLFFGLWGSFKEYKSNGPVGFVLTSNGLESTLASTRYSVRAVKYGQNVLSYQGYVSRH